MDRQQRSVLPALLMLTLLMGCAGFALGRFIPPTLGPLSLVAATSTATPTSATEGARIKIAHICATAIAYVLHPPTDTPVPRTTPSPFSGAGAALGRALGIGFVGGLCSTYEADPTLYMTATARGTPALPVFPAPPTPAQAGTP